MVVPSTASANAYVTAAFADDAPRVVAKDGTYLATLNVTNRGTSAAEEAMVNMGVWGNANEFSPTGGTHPPFRPVVTYPGGCDAITDSTCKLGTLAPGQTRSVTVAVTQITHFGRLNMQFWGRFKGGNLSATGGYSTWQVQVTNGKSSVVRVDAEAPQSASGSTDIVVPGEIVNVGPDTLDQAILRINTSRFNTVGNPVRGNDTEVSSIRSLKLSNGTVCAPWVNPADNKATANTFTCPVSGMAPSSRLGFELVVNYPTGLQDFPVTIEGELVTTTFLARGSAAGFTKRIELNPGKTVDLAATATGQALIGADRLAAVKVTVTNKGNAKAEGVSINGDARRGVGGTFDKDSLPTTCSGIVKPQTASCFVGEIEPGKSAVVTMTVRAGTALGLLPVSFGTWHASDVVETNPDDNATTVTMQVVKADAVPFVGVRDVRPPATVQMAAFLRSGAPTTVTCPSGCRAQVSLQVRRNVAERLGLVPRPRPGARRAAAAKPLPYIVIGTATKARSSKGKVVVSAKVTRAYKVKLAALRAPLTISRVVKVTATSAGIRGATYTSTRAMTVRPAPARPARPARR